MMHRQWLLTSTRVEVSKAFAMNRVTDPFPIRIYKEKVTRLLQSYVTKFRNLNELSMYTALDLSNIAISP